MCTTTIDAAIYISTLLALWYFGGEPTIISNGYFGY
jgi:hypothetical protein